MDRRTYLAEAAVTTGALLGGCLQTWPEGQDHSSPIAATDTATGTPVPNRVTIDEIVVRKAITYTSMMGPSGVRTPDGRQYVVAGVRSTTELGSEPFSFHTKEDSWPPTRPGSKGSINRAVAGIEGAPLGYPGLETERYVLAFELPSPMESGAPQIKYSPDDADAGEQTWKLDQQQSERLAASEPQFTLQALDVPEEKSESEELTVSLRVQNATEVPGRFLAAVYWPTPMVADDDTAHIIDREVAATADASVTVTIESMYRPPEESATGTGPPPETRTLAIEGHVSATRDITVNR